MKIKFAALFAAALLLCCCLAGCNKESSDEGGRIKTYNTPEFIPAGEITDGGANVYLIVKKIDNSYFKVMFDAAKDAQAELGCNVYYSGSEDSSEWEVQAALMDIAMKNGADAVILAPDDTARLADKVNELYKSGVAVICVDAVVNTDSYDVCYMTDNLEAGEQAAKEMLSHLRGSGLSESEKALIAIQSGRSSSQTVNERVAGFCRYWAENAPADWTIIDDIKSNEGSDDKSLPVAEEFFSQYEGIKGVFGTNLAATRGFAKYVSQNGRNDVAVVGFDYCDEIAALINDRSYMASAMLQRQYEMAYNGIKAAVEIKSGTFSSDGKLVDTGVLAVNNGNINDPDVKPTVERN